MSEFQEILESLGYHLKEAGQYWRAKPLYRHSNNDSVLVINKENGVYFDHKLKQGGSFEQLVSLTNGDLTSEQLDNIRSQILKSETRLRRDKVYKFSPSVLSKLKPDHSFYSMQGISEKTLACFKGGVAQNSDLRNRYVFPIIQGKHIIGFSGKDTTYKSKIKWIHMGNTSSWQFPLFINEKFIIESKEVILVESIGNILRLWDNGIKNAICCFGTKVGKGVFQLLIKYNIKKIIIAFDNDLPDQNGIRAGLLGANKAKKKLDNFFDTGVVSIRLPEQEGKDIFDLSNNEVKKRYGKFNSI